MSAKLFSVHDYAKSLNLSHSLTDKIIQRGLIPTLEEKENNSLQLLTTIYGTHQLQRISHLIDQGIALPDIENAIEH